MVIEPTSDMTALPFTSHFLFMSSRPGYYDIFFGERLKACDVFIKDIIEKEITLVVVLLTENEMTRMYRRDLCAVYMKNRLECVHYPIEDGSVPADFESFDKLNNKINDRLQVDNVLVHCSAGLGRTGTVAAGVLICDGHTAEKAIDKVRKNRSGAVENGVQERFLKEYYVYNAYSAE